MFRFRQLPLLLLLSGCSGKDADSDSQGSVPTDPASGSTIPTGISTGTPAGTTPCVPAAETCDGTDEDCDGVIDDGPCSAPDHTGAWFLRGSGVDHVRGIAVDPAGNTYITGAVTSPAVLDGPVTGSHGYVASLDPAGAVRWSAVWGDSGTNYGQEVDVRDGVVCAGGGFSGDHDFGGGTRTASGSLDAVVLCLDAADGGYRFDRTFGGAAYDVIEGVRIGAAGQVVVAGDVEGPVDFGDGVPVATTGAFAAQLDSAGGTQWARVWENTYIDFSALPAVDDGGNVVVVPIAWGPVDFGGGVRTPSNRDGAVVALDGSGNWRWDHLLGNAVTPYGADFQSDGTVVVGGDLGADVDLGGGTVGPASYGGRALFAAAWAPDGSFRWHYVPGGPGSTRGFDVDVGPDDQVLLAAQYDGTVDFGGGPTTAAVGYDGFAVGLTAGGLYWWDTTFGGDDDEAANGIAADPTGRAVVGGESWGPMTLAGVAHTNGGSADGLVLWLD